MVVFSTRPVLMGLCGLELPLLTDSILKTFLSALFCVRALYPLIIPLAYSENPSHVTVLTRVAFSKEQLRSGCKKMALPQLEAVSALKCVTSPGPGPGRSQDSGSVIIHPPRPAGVSPCSSHRSCVPWVAAAQGLLSSYTDLGHKS